MIIKNGNLVTPTATVRSDIRISDGRIVEIGNCLSDNETFDAEGLYVCPGLVDIHTHGGFGGDFMDSNEEAIGRVLDFHSKYGTTSLLATTVTAPVDRIEKMIKTVRKYRDDGKDRSCRILGIHLEGPYLSLKNKGAQSEKYLKIPSRDSFDFILRNKDIIKTVTLSPELEGACEMTRQLRKSGIVVCGGHDDGERRKILPVIEAGLSHCTHLWCAMSTVAIRDGIRDIGLFELGLLDDRLTVELIADGHHITPEMVKLVYKCKGADKICLVSDSLRAGGMPQDGRIYTLGDERDETAQRFVVSDGVAKLPDHSRFAGSIQPISQMVKNIVLGTDIPLFEAIRMASLNPARVIGLDGEVGSIEVGKRADICIMDKELNVVGTMVGGKIL